MTAATIAAILIKAGRDQYHATGRPCACPDDTMRNGGTAALGPHTLDRAGQRRFAILPT